MVHYKNISCLDNNIEFNYGEKLIKHKCDYYQK